MKRALITGGAGFIGSNLADRLTSDGVEVVVYDDFRTGDRRFLEGAAAGADLVAGDVLDLDRLGSAMDGCDTVFHLQANADVRHGLEHPTRDLEQNVEATSNVLEAMRRAGVERIAFSSTGSIYGEPDLFPTPEDCPFPVQTSLYGASKLAAEGLIAAYCHGLGFTGVALRFVSVLGERYTHGHVFDFFAALRARSVAPADPRRRAAAEELHVRRRLRRGDPDGRSTPPRRASSRSSTSAPTRLWSWTTRWRSSPARLASSRSSSTPEGAAVGRETRRSSTSTARSSAARVGPRR